MNMDKEAARLFITNILKGYYKKWKPSELEMDDWAEKLQVFDYERARTAMRSFYFSPSRGTSTTPPPGKIIAALYSNSPRRERRVTETIKTKYYIQCIQPPDDNPKYSDRLVGVFALDGDKQDDHEYMIKCQSQMREKSQALYGGVWLSIYDDRVEEDSGLRGQQAWDKFCADVLNGEDSDLKWFLNTILNKRYGDVLKVVPSLVDPEQGKKIKKQQSELLKGAKTRWQRNTRTVK